MTDNIALAEEPKRSDEYLKLLEELKRSFISAGEIVIKLYEQGKRDNLPNHIIRKDIEVALDGIINERRLRELLPLELKRNYTINKDHNSALIAELDDDEYEFKLRKGLEDAWAKTARAATFAKTDEEKAQQTILEEKAREITTRIETSIARRKMIRTHEHNIKALEARINQKRHGEKWTYKDWIEMAIAAWNSKVELEKFGVK